MTNADPHKFCLDCGYPIEGLPEARCPECGRPFDPSDVRSYSQDDGALQKVYVARDETDAHHLRRRLGDAGIRAVVMGDHLAAAVGRLNPLTPSSVWVGARNVDRVASLIEQHVAARRDGPHDPHAEAWTCGGCGERIEGQFTSCWSCGAVRPDDRRGDPKSAP